MPAGPTILFSLGPVLVSKLAVLGQKERIAGDTSDVNAMKLGSVDWELQTCEMT